MNTNINTKIKVPYVDIIGQHMSIKEELLQAVGKVIEHGHFVLGKEVAEFEEKFAKLCGVKYAVGLSSGTDALILALKALGIGPGGDEVITVCNSFMTTTSAIVLSGARPVFVDVADDYNIDPSLIEGAITPRTRAILPVHLTGRPADMDPIMEIAKRRGLYVVEDCAQAVYAEYKGKPVGSFGDIGCFSLHPLKTLNACGDGGVLTTNSEQLYNKLIVLRNNGFKNRDECVCWSSNSRLDTIQAAMLLVKLKYLNEWTNRRRDNAAFYKDKLSGLEKVSLPSDKPYEKAVYHTFVISADYRDELKEFLFERGVETKIHYPISIHLQPAARNLGYKHGDFSVAEKQASRILSLPVYPELTQSDLEYVVQCVFSFYEQKGNK
ncbi:MAG: DegT/DnrJ/EryC1/StrS family aminotransferase [Candidatus Omnitrophota bacterium]